jgi:ribosomal protein S8
MDSISCTINALLNAQRAGFASTSLTLKQTGASSKVRELLRARQREGYIVSVSFVPSTEVRSSHNFCTVDLKYGPSGEPTFRSYFRVSTPGRRVFVSAASV